MPSAGFRSTEYQYEALEGHDTVRLLMIESPPWDDWKWDAEFVPWCRLEHFRLSEAPPYRALSYAWGSPKMKPIFLNRHKIKIRRNLWKALWHLRYMGFHDSEPNSRSSNQSQSSLQSQESKPLSEDGPIWIWIDAICIDQHNVAERNHQVRFMGMIYKMAQEVFVWLGCVDQQECTAGVRHEDERIPGKSIYNAICDIKELTQSPDNGPKLIQDLASGVAIPGFKGLLTGLPYWRRMWIVQEIGLASKITLLFDEASTRWENLQAFRTLLDSHEMHFELQTHTRFADDIEELRKCQAFVLDSHRRETQRNGLADWIESCIACNCHDPRDKVYGLVGLAHDYQNTGDDASNILKVDYSRSLFEVYSDTIDFYQASKRARRGPSQHVVRFSQVLQQSFNKPMELELGARAYISEQPDGDLPLMHVFGLLGGRIERVGAPLDSNQFFKSLCGAPMEFPHCPYMGKYLLGDIDRIISTTSQASFAVYASEASQENLLWNISRDIQPTVNIPKHSKREPQKCIPILMDNSQFDQTGYAPTKTLPGDFICQFLGCDVAAVLRPRERGFDIIGRAILAKQPGEREDEDVLPWTKRYPYAVPDYYDNFNWGPNRAMYLYLDMVTLQQLTG